jgi:Acyltransferase family
MLDARRGPDHAPVEHPAAVARWASRRLRYADNLKVILIAAIIAGHAVASYTSMELWSYADVREVTLSPVTEAVLLAVVMPFALFMIPLLFLIAGLLTPSSLERKGAGVYVRDRLVRLGVPFAVFCLLVWPALLYALYRPLGNAPGSYLAELVGTSQEALDTGYLWFVGDLLLFSLAYAAWVRLRHGRAGRPRQLDVGARHLLVLAAVVGVATFLVRLVFPFASERYVDLNWYQWPECVALFALGVVTARSGWLTAVPERLRRHSRTATLVAAGGFAVFVAWGTVSGGLAGDTWTGGWHVEAFMFAALEGALAVFGPVWLLAVAQRRLDRPLSWADPVVGRSAYGAFIVQGLVLIGLTVALRPLPVAAEAKALIVAAGGVTGSFAFAWLLITRVPGMARVL